MRRYFDCYDDQGERLTHLPELAREWATKPTILPQPCHRDAMIAERAAMYDKLDAEDAEADPVSIVQTRRDWDLCRRALDIMHRYIDLETHGRLSAATDSHFRGRIVGNG